MDWNENVDSHPSYALLSFSRVTGDIGPLFGSSIQHHHMIRMELCHAEVKRDLNHNWYCSRDSIVVVDMSAAQFAEAITAMNTGPGVPVTLRYINGKEVEKCKFVDEQDQIHNEFKEKIKWISSRLASLGKQATEILQNGNLKKADRENLNSIISSLIQDITANMPYVHDCFVEAMEKTVTAAKAEVESQVLYTINKYGIEKLQELHGKDTGHQIEQG